MSFEAPLCEDFSSHRLKNYRIKNNEWHCQTCSIYCNSTLQFEMHLISQKHKIICLERKAGMETSSAGEIASEATPGSNSSTEFSANNGNFSSPIKTETSLDENNNLNSQPNDNCVTTISNQNQRSSNVRIKSSYSPSKFGFFYLFEKLVFK